MDDSILNIIRGRLSQREYDKTFSQMVLDYGRAVEEGEKERAEALSQICGTMVMMGDDSLVDGWAIADRITEYHYQIERAIKSDKPTEEERKRLRIELEEIARYRKEPWPHDRQERELKDAIDEADPEEGCLIGRVDAIMEEMISRGRPGDFHSGHLREATLKFVISTAEPEEVAEALRYIVEKLTGDMS